MNEQTNSATESTKRYRTEIPNMADEQLDPFQYRLYAHYKRVCGDTGSCWESLDTTATKCKMSRDKVIQSRKWLCDNGWIALEQKAKGVYSIQVINRWDDNCELFTSRNIDCKLQEPIVSPVEISTDTSEPVEISTDNDGVSDSPVEISTTTSRNIDTKKELYKKEHIFVADATQRTSLKTTSVVEKKKRKRKETQRTAQEEGGEPSPAKEPTEHQMMFEKICQIVGWDWKTLGEKEKGQVAQTLGILKKADYTLEELNRFGREVWAKDWRWIKHKQFPTLSLLRTEIGKLRQDEKQKAELKVDTDSVSWRNVFETQNLSKYQWGTAA